MNKYRFDEYHFSINTKVIVHGQWYKVVGVDFVDRIIEVRILGKKVACTSRSIKDIKD